MRRLKSFRLRYIKMVPRLIASFFPRRKPSSGHHLAPRPVLIFNSRDKYRDLVSPRATAVRAAKARSEGSARRDFLIPGFAFQ